MSNTWIEEQTIKTRDKIKNKLDKMSWQELDDIDTLIDKKDIILNFIKVIKDWRD